MPFLAVYLHAIVSAVTVHPQPKSQDTLPLADYDGQVHRAHVCNERREAVAVPSTLR